MKDETYPPPPRAPRETPDYNPKTKTARSRKVYMVISIILMLFAVALNFSNNTNLIKLRVRPDILPGGVAEVAARLQNSSLMTIYVSRVYTLEAQDGESWREIAGNAGTVDATYFSLGRFGGIDLTFGRYGVFQPLAPGKYRLALSLVAQPAILGSARALTLYAEFTVE